MRLGGTPALRGVNCSRVFFPSIRVRTVANPLPRTKPINPAPTPPMTSAPISDRVMKPLLPPIAAPTTPLTRPHTEPMPRTPRSLFTKVSSSRRLIGPARCALANSAVPRWSRRASRASHPALPRPPHGLFDGRRGQATAPPLHRGPGIGRSVHALEMRQGR